MSTQPVKEFLLSNIGFFFVLIIFFGYADYFSKWHPRPYKVFSPIITAAGLVVAIWILANLMIVSEIFIVAPMMHNMAGCILGKLVWVFALVTLLGYLLLIIKIGKKSKKGGSFCGKKTAK